MDYIIVDTIFGVMVGKLAGVEKNEELGEFIVKIQDPCQFSMKQVGNGVSALELVPIKMFNEVKVKKDSYYMIVNEDSPIAREHTRVTSNIVTATIVPPNTIPFKKS
jgi:hypothetical protein